MNKTIKITGLLATLTLGGLLLSGCAPQVQPAPSSAPVVTEEADESMPETKEPETSTEAPTLVAPLMIELSTLDGSTREILAGTNVVLDTGDIDPSTVSGIVSDSKVASFVAGGDSGSATMNPSIKLNGVGSTEVTITYGEQTIKFTLIVVAPQ